jgi:hypothetical protein
MKNWIQLKGARMQTIGVAVALLMLPLAAWAQHSDDEHNQPLDPQAKALQLWTFGAVALVVVLGVGWYWLRRWQIVRSGKSVDGSYRDD